MDVWLVSTGRTLFKGVNQAIGEIVWTALRCDLVSGSTLHLQATSKVYAQDDSVYKFVGDFVQAWTRVVNAGLIG